MIFQFRKIDLSKIVFISLLNYNCSCNKKEKTNQEGDPIRKISHSIVESSQENSLNLAEETESWRIFKALWNFDITEIREFVFDFSLFSDSTQSYLVFLQKLFFVHSDIDKSIF